MRRITFHIDGKKAYVDITDYQYRKLRKEQLKNMNHCDAANEPLNEFIGCVLQKYATIIEEPVETANAHAPTRFLTRRRA